MQKKQFMQCGAAATLSFLLPSLVSPASVVAADLSSFVHETTTGLSDSYDPHDPFYIPPAVIPSQPGTLIRSESAAHPLNVGVDALPGNAHRMLYSSLDVNGRPVAVSGYVIEPLVPWLGSGPTPTVVFAPGTRGAGDACAPSRALGFVAATHSHTDNVNINYELLSQYQALAAGMRVVSTDYIGLGTPGPHTYVLHTEEGRAVLDAARAGLHLAGQPADSPVAFWGYSQGGGAAAAAAELAASYAPELTVAATYAGAPPADLIDVMEAVDGSSIVGVLGYAIAGISDRDPELAAEMDLILNDTGKAFVADSADDCVLDSIASYAGLSTTTLTTDGRTLADIARTHPALREFFDSQHLGNTPVTGPILITTEANDDIIPSAQVEQFAADQCALGASVTFLDHSTPPLTDDVPLAANHAMGMFSDLPYGLAYLADAFNDTPATPNCGSW
ncbi:lipase family protein [Corynebacterium uterequi]|uniref:Secretory lipase n=1 Tax=Corynebacterium uterequi TaxID=1072256 RepID=A0A0G3HES9_9CORY|nr:lipase family protein [Corynebacterium uterequi]AKK11861.1 Secretory lipase [Corynebacterium uterequi]